MERSVLEKSPDELTEELLNTPPAADVELDFDDEDEDDEDLDDEDEDESDE